MANSPDDSPGANQHNHSNQHTGHSGGGQSQGAHQGTAPQGGYQTGPNLSDVLNVPATVTEIKIGLVVYAAIAIGLGIGAFGLMTVGGTSTGFNATALFVVFVTLLSPFFLGAAIAGVLGLRHARVLADQPQNLLLGTAAVTGFAGTIVMFVVGFVFSVLAAGGSGSGGGGQIADFVLPLLIVCIGAALAGTACAWAGRNILPRAGRGQTAVGAGQRQ